MEEVISDTLREQVTVVVMDTVREITTVTVRENEVGDTLRVTTVTDRTRASSRDRYHDIQEKVIVRTDTVYIERDSLAVKEIAVQARNEDTPARNSIRILRWICFILLALVALIIALRIFVLRR